LFFLSPTIITGIETANDSSDTDALFATGLNTTAVMTSTNVAKAKAFPHSNHGDSSIFLVHGRNPVFSEVARFLEGLDKKVIILQEEPSGGFRTVIEKFLKQAKKASFAVILLTADDRGGPVQAYYKHQQPRARQNVIFELGYFVGRLGRKRICVLYDKEVEMASDFAGITYIKLDENNGWRLGLIQALKDAGFHVDANKAIQP
jgi:predicted nucleotide-binding protein